MMRGRGALRGRGAMRGRGRPHRPRTGRQGGGDAELDRRFYADGSAVAATDAANASPSDVPAVAVPAELPPPSSAPAPPPPQQQQQRDVKKAPKPTSDFTLLHGALSDAESIAEYVRTYHARRFAVAKQLNTFLQAISCRPDAVYDELTQQYKAEVMLVLDRLYSHLSLGKVACTPAAHEFVLRCEACGVRRGEWAGQGASPPAVPGAEPSLFTPRELLKKLAACDPLGRLQRMVEMARTVAELERCARKMTVLFTSDAVAQHEELKAMQEAKTVAHDKAADKTRKSSATAAVPRSASVSATAELSYATRCQLVSKLLSKARRIVTLAHDDGSKEDTVTRQQPCPTTKAGSDDEDDENTRQPHAAAQSVLTISDEDRAAFTTLVTHLIDLVQTVLSARPASTTQQPIAKCVHFARWCAARQLITDADLARVTDLEAEAQKDMQTQATQLETVMRLKALQQSGDVDALTTMLDELWQAGAGGHFSPFSADVLSAIATATAADTVPQPLKETVAARLVGTQQALRDNGVELPRRALKFIQTVRSAQKAASAARVASSV